MHLKYISTDQFNQAMFCAAEDSHTDEEKASYKELCRYHRKLDKRRYGTFLPIYSDLVKKYATMRLKKSPTRPNFKPRAIYDVQFEVKSVTRDGKTYVNCWHRSSTLVKPGTPFYTGEDMEFSDSDLD